MGDDVTYALRAFAARFGNARFRRVTVTGVDAPRRCVRTDADDEIGYDYLLLCCGVTANYFGIPGPPSTLGRSTPAPTRSRSGTRRWATWRPTPRAAPRPWSR